MAEHESSWLVALAAKLRVPVEGAALVFVQAGGGALRPEDLAGLSSHEIAALVAARRRVEVQRFARLATALHGTPEDVLAELDGGEARERRALSDFADAVAAGAAAGAAHARGGE